VERELNNHLKQLDILVNLQKTYLESLNSDKGIISSNLINLMFSGTLLELANVNGLSLLLKEGRNDIFWEPDLWINGFKCRCLVDSGASCSVVSGKLLETESLKSSNLIIKPSNRVISMADESSTTVDGVVTIPLLVAGKETTVELLIMKELGYDLILGRKGRKRWRFLHTEL
jgi:hypothetical protein